MSEVSSIPGHAAGTSRTDANLAPTFPQRWDPRGCHKASGIIGAVSVVVISSFWILPLNKMPLGERRHVFLYLSLANKYSLASQQSVLKTFCPQC